MAHPWRKLERNKEIYFKYTCLHYRLHELAQEYHISSSRVQQIIMSVEHHIHNKNPDYI